MTKAELKMFNEIKSPHSKFWVPAEWAFNLVRIAREKEVIRSDIVYTQLMEARIKNPHSLDRNLHSPNKNSNFLTKKSYFSA